ncbi:MAG: hypothetical protein JNL64_12395 [Blastocatellia bacterium]|nr:hypothetical protein [Blastocatellia bacterium]
MAALEKMFDSMSEGWDNPEADDVSYHNWLEKMQSDSSEFRHVGRKPSSEQIKAFIEIAELVKKHRNFWGNYGEHNASSNAPKPRTRLRHRAQI